MTNTTKSQKHLGDLLDELGRRIAQETEWANKGYDDSEFAKGQADMAREIRERLVTIYVLLNNDITAFEEQLGE